MRASDMTQSTEMLHALSLVEAWLRDNGLQPENTRQATTGSTMIWALQRGSATVFITLQPTLTDTMLNIYSPILHAPEASRREAFYHRLLRLNFDDLSACAFALDEDNDVVVTTDRTIADLSMVELDELITAVATFADEFDNILADDFGAEMMGEE